MSQDERNELLDRVHRSDRLFKVFLSALFIFLIGILIGVAVLLANIDNDVKQNLHAGKNNQQATLQAVRDENRKLVVFVECILTVPSNVYREDPQAAVDKCERIAYPNEGKPEGKSSSSNTQSYSFLVDSGLTNNLQLQPASIGYAPQGTGGINDTTSPQVATNSSPSTQNKNDGSTASQPPQNKDTQPRPPQGPVETLVDTLQQAVSPLDLVSIKGGK